MLMHKRCLSVPNSYGRQLSTCEIWIHCPMNHYTEFHWSTISHSIMFFGTKEMETDIMPRDLFFLSLSVDNNIQMDHPALCCYRPMEFGVC